MNHPSRSDEQQAIEPLVLGILAKQTGLTYASERIQCGDEYVEIDGVGRNANSTVVELVEVYARQGKLKGGQMKKPTDDAARLMLARLHIAGAPKLRLAWCSEEAVRQVQNGWRGKALEAMGVELSHVALEVSQAASITAAQARQTR